MSDFRINFEQMRSPEIGKFAENGGTVLLPVGACEEHGRHLPVVTDTMIAREACIDAARNAAERFPVSVLPPVYYGYSVAVLKNWPGTVTIRPKVLIDFLYDICRSLIDMGLEKILIVNGHGNNPGVLDVVVRSIGDDCKVFPGVVNVYGLWDKEFVSRHRQSPEGGIGHAGEIETSLMLHLCGELVDMTLADDSDLMKSRLQTCPVDFASGRKKKLFLSTWYLENPVHGGAGDPTKAAKEFGKQIHEMTVEGLTQVIEEFHDIHERYKNRKLNRTNTAY